jgi:hypothetical protein
MGGEMNKHVFKTEIIKAKCQQCIGKGRRFATTIHRAFINFDIFRAIAKLLVIFVAASVNSALAQDAPEGLEPSITRVVVMIDAELVVVRIAIDKELGEPVSKDSAQCGVLPMGAKTCGGSTRYVAYSRQVSDSQLLSMLADQYTRLQFARNVLTQAISDCSISQPPTVLLINGRCHLTSGE